MAVHVQCNSCGAWAITEDHEALGPAVDSVVQCTSPAGQPKGSPEGSCCAEHESLDHHNEQVALTRDSSCRPVTITIMGTPEHRVQAYAVAPHA